MTRAWLLLSLLLVAGPAAATRYALVVANDRAPDLPKLEHAEEDAEEIVHALVELGRFEPTRIELVQGGTRDEIRAASARLVERRAQDRARFGDVPTLFAMFFSGHGEAGRLLARDGPLEKDDLRAIVEQMDATLTVGVFDACYSGSLELTGELKEKGVTPLPFNALEALPDEVLRAEGTLWLVSSRPTEVSYEDRELGGVFSHFFVEGMARAPSSGPGITLDEIWAYAQRRTRAYTTERGRPQTPQKLVERLRAEGPLIFSYPRDRTARLVLGEELEGAFVLRYSSELADVIDKARGQARSIAVLPGSFVLERRGTRMEIEVAPGEEVRVHDAQDFSPARGIGSRDALVEKRGDLLATRRAPAASLLLEAGGLGAIGAPLSTTAPLAGSVGARVDFGPWVARLEGRYGAVSERFAAWSYDAQRAGLSAAVGPAWDLWTGRLGVELALGGTWQHVSFGDGARRDQIGPLGEAAVSWIQPLLIGAVLDARLGVGSELLPPAPEQADARLSPYALASLSIGIQLF